MIPNATHVPKEVGEQKLRHNRIVCEQNTCSWNWMSAQLAVVAIVFSSKFSLGSLSDLGRSEESLSFLAATSNPTLPFAVSRFHGPREVLDLDHLPKKCCRGVRATVLKKIRA
jgi:hypothetical protein